MNDDSHSLLREIRDATLATRDAVFRMEAERIQTARLERRMVMAITGFVLIVAIVLGSLMWKTIPLMNRVLAEKAKPIAVHMSLAPREPPG